MMSLLPYRADGYLLLLNISIEISTLNADVSNNSFMTSVIDKQLLTIRSVGEQKKGKDMRYRIREGSIADYARYAITGFVFFVTLALIAGGAI